ncbi:hypothetical protein GCM10010446_68510 [Streptomyces enissocaesilis]|uniref:Uncharacterized protein n=1 Tax=Streptomyces enissocaesilis TaxID=332589 RepID=A0ABP6K9A2_9ACTN
MRCDDDEGNEPAGHALAVRSGRHRTCGFCGTHIPGLQYEPLRTRVVVLLAACMSDRARDARLEGPAVADVAPAEALTIVERYPVSSLEGRGTPGDGHRPPHRTQLLHLFGTPGFDAVRSRVRHGIHLARARRTVEARPGGCAAVRTSSESAPPPHPWR